MRILRWKRRRWVHLELRTKVSFIQIPIFRILALPSIISQAALCKGWLNSAQSSLVISQQHCFWHLFQPSSKGRTLEMACCTVPHRVGNLTVAWGKNATKMNKNPSKFKIRGYNYLYTIKLEFKIREQSINKIYTVMICHNAVLFCNKWNYITRIHMLYSM